MTPETGLSQLRGLPETAITKLRSRRILTDTELWNRLARTPTLLSDIPLSDAERANTLRALGQHAAAVGASMTSRWIVQYAPDIMVLTLLSSFVVLVAAKPVRPGPSPDTAKVVAAPEQPLTIPAAATPVRLLQVTFPMESGALLKELPQRIALAASTAGPPPSGIVVEDVYVLRVQSVAGGTLAIIGTSAENVAALAPYLAAGKLVPVMSRVAR